MGFTFSQAPALHNIQKWMAWNLGITELSPRNTAKIAYKYWTIPGLKKQELNSLPHLMNMVEFICCSVYGIDVFDYRENLKNRAAPYKECRQVFMVMAMQHLRVSCVAASAQCGKDHATAINAKKVVKALTSYDKALKEKYVVIEEKVLQIVKSNA